MPSFTFQRIPIAKSATNDAIVWLTAKTETIEWFKLYDLPRPRGWKPSADGSPTLVHMPLTPTSKAGGKRYRIAYEFVPTSRKPAMAAFKLGNGHNRETLHLIARHLDTCGQPWLWLCNEYGNHLGGNWSYATPKP